MKILCRKVLVGFHLHGYLPSLQVMGGSVSQCAPLSVSSLQVSAGYDAHWRDPLAGMQLRTSTYHELGARLRALAEEVCQVRLQHACNAASWVANPTKAPP